MKRFSDYLGEPILTSKHGTKAASFGRRFLALAHQEFLGDAQKSARDGHREEAAHLKEVAEDVLVLMNKVGKRAEPALKPNGEPTG